MGGNQPETLQAFRVARTVLENVFHDVRVSALYRTSPQLDVDQSDFWNSAISGLWGKSLFDLLDRLQAVEASCGRSRDPSRPKGPRVLDLDILWASSVQTRSDRLEVPHPGLTQRRFALEPLLEVEPHAIELATGRTYGDLCQLLPDQGVERSSQTW